MAEICLPSGFLGHMELESVLPLASQKGQKASLNKGCKNTDPLITSLRFGNFLPGKLSITGKIKCSLQNISWKLNNRTSRWDSISRNYLQQRTSPSLLIITIFTTNLQTLFQNEACLHPHSNHSSLQMQHYYFFKSCLCVVNSTSNRSFHNSDITTHPDITNFFKLNSTLSLSCCRHPHPLPCFGIFCEKREQENKNENKNFDHLTWQPTASPDTRTGSSQTITQFGIILASIILMMNKSFKKSTPRQSIFKIRQVII